MKIHTQKKKKKRAKHTKETAVFPCLQDNHWKQQTFPGFYGCRTHCNCFGGIPKMLKRQTIQISKVSKRREKNKNKNLKKIRAKPQRSNLGNLIQRGLETVTSRITKAFKLKGKSKKGKKQKGRTKNKRNTDRKHKEVLIYRHRKQRMEVKLAIK